MLCVCMSHIYGHTKVTVWGCILPCFKGYIECTDGIQLLCITFKNTLLLPSDLTTKIIRASENLTCACGFHVRASWSVS